MPPSKPKTTAGWHIRCLEDKIRNLRAQVEQLRACVEDRNLWIRSEANDYIVRCTGGCPEGYDWENMTEEQIQEVEKIAVRLREGWTNYHYRQQHEG